MAVIADIDADFCIPGLKDGIAEVAGFEEEFLPEAGSMRDMVLAVFAQQGAVGVDDGGGVVEYAGLFLFIDRDDHDHGVFSCILRHALGSGAGYGFCRLIPAAVLAGAEIGGVKDLLEAEDLYAFCTCLVDQRQVFLEHGLLYLCDGTFAFCFWQAHLDETGSDQSGHVLLFISFR